MGKSVTRRIIAIMFALCGAGVMSFLALHGSVEAFTALNSIVALVIGYYFGVQAAKTQGG